MPRLLALLLGALAAGCGEPPPPPIVLISIDTLRSDRLPAYGYGGVDTPAIDALRRDGVLFTRAYSTAPTTLPAHASMLTGLLPPDHGVRGNLGYRLEPGRTPWVPALLAARGYATGAAVASFVMRSESGLDHGFDFYEDEIDYRAGVGSAGLQRSGGETVRSVLPWLRSVGDRPFFLFVHLYEPHSPYQPPEPYASRYESPYDGEIAAADEVVAELLAELRALDLYDRAAVILTSDHGEGLGDHGEDEHGIFVYRESLQVPLVLKLPRSRWAGRAVETPVQLPDLAPTILRLARQKPPPAMAGLSLLDLVEDPQRDRPLYAETYFPRFYFGWSELVSVIDGRYQYIESPDPELYDLVADPGQSRNLVAREREAAARLRRAAAAYERNLENPRDADLETWERMASLGYVGHGQTRIEGRLPSPRSQVHLLATLRQGLGLAARGEHEEAAARFAQVVAESPHALVAWEQLGRSLEWLGRARPAREAYLRALDISGRAPHLLLAAARTSLRAGEPERAAELAREAVAWDEAAARTILAESALAAGELDEAERQARGALARRSPNVEAMLTLAHTQLRRGELEDALGTVRQAAEAAGGEPVPRLELLRANILVNMGRVAEAEAALRREIEHFPRDTAAYSRLALSLARQGRGREAVDALRLLVESNPDPAGYAAAVRTLDRLGDPRSAAALLAQARTRFPDSEELAALEKARAAGAAGPGR